MHDDLIDSIYEAAFAPDMWAGVLADLAARFHCRESGMIVVRPGDPEWIATPRCSDYITAYREANGDDGLYYENARTQRFDRLKHGGFLTEQALLTRDELDVDPFQAGLRCGELEWQAFSRIALPGDAVLSVSLERQNTGRPFARQEIAGLDALYGHFTRAGIIASRFGLEQARTRVGMMADLDLPAAVVTFSGKVFAANALFESMSNPLMVLAGDRVAVADPAADIVLRRTIEAIAAGETRFQSIPVGRNGERRASFTIHLLPLRRTARDLFSAGDLLMVVSPVDPGAHTPSPGLLRTLFDISPAEAKLATALANGVTLRQAASECGLTLSSARTYLTRIFRKTGTSQQSQLVALLKSVQPFRRQP